MTRTGALVLLVASVAPVACRKSSRTESNEPMPSTPIERAAARQPEAAPAPPALDIGPTASADPEARKQAVITLLAGELAAESLPEVATEPGVPLEDDRLRDRLAPVGSGSTGPAVRR